MNRLDTKKGFFVNGLEVSPKVYTQAKWQNKRIALLRQRLADPTHVRPWNAIRAQERSDACRRDEESWQEPQCEPPMRRMASRDLKPIVRYISKDEARRIAEHNLGFVPTYEAPDVL